MRKKFLLMLTLLIIALGGSGKLFAQNVAKVGNTEYATIDEAIAAWENGGTMTLLKSVTLNRTIKLNSTKVHILNLGTYTMTAASGKDAIEILPKGVGTAAKDCLTINADATNPGGITASGKSCIYYYNSEKIADRMTVTINGGVFAGSYAINQLTGPKNFLGLVSSPLRGQGAAYCVINGGTFNAQVFLNAGMLKVTGGVFHKNLTCYGDQTAHRLISGGRFKSMTMTADASNKFAFGTAKETYNVGLYVDKDGYLCVGGPVITETSKDLPAVASNATKWSSYLTYSSAATYGLFYEDVDMAIKKHGEANVTVWVKPAVTIPETLTGDVVEEIKKNTALEDYTPENLPTGAELEIELVSVGETFVYDVTPMANGEEVEPTEAITFRLPVPASVTKTYAKVYHDGTLMGIYDIQGEGNAKYVEIASANFSEFTVEPIVPAAKIGTTAYETLSTAFAAVTDDNQTVVICKDVTENLTSTLRGNITTENNAKVTITLTNSDWVSCPYTFVVGENITLNVPALFYYAGGTQINGTVVAGAYYQRYAGTKLTINEPGSMTVTSETCIIRYMDGDPNAGIYVVGDNNDETVGLKLSVAYFYQGMINAKDANIVAGTYWQTNETDGQGTANLVLDNSTLTVTVYDHPAKATGNSTVTLTNGSVIDAKNGGFTYGDATVLSVDATSRIIGTGGEDVKLPVAKIGTTNYKTLAEAVNAVQEGQTITIFAGEISEGTIKLPSTLKNVKFLGAAEHATVLKDMTIMAADGNSFNYEGLTFDGLYFNNSRISLTGWRNGDETINNLTVTNCWFKNLNDDTNSAPVHINKDAAEAVNGFTFTNNVIDGATGGSKSGVYAQLTGNVVFTNNVINNVSFRPYVIQLTTDDGVADTFTVEGNTFSGSKVGRAQGLGNNAEGTDAVALTVSNNIFEGITDSQQICYWNFNAATTTAVLSGNYYDIDVLANPGKIYFNTSAQGVGDLVEMGIFPYYTELNANGTINTESAVQVPAAIAKIGEKNYYSLQKALNDAAAGTGNVTVEILDNINLTGIDWNPVTVSAPGYPVVTVEGNNNTITGLNDMLFAGTWAGNSGLIIKNLVIANSEIKHDVEDTKGNIGVGAFVGFPQASSVITLDNCHLVNSTVEGGHWTGGLIGYAAGYAGTDGPVFMNLTVNNCSVKESTITGKGSVGGIIGHGSGNAWTMVEIKETTVSGNTITSTGTSVNKAGAVMGTIGAAGQATTVNGVEKQGGALVAATVSGNTVTSHGTAITTIYGRQGTNTGVLELNGGSYDKYPIEKGVAYAKPAEGFVIKENANGTFGVKSFEGEGTAEKPYMINDLEELIAFRNSVNSGAKTFSAPGVYVALGADIDLKNEEWTPIGNITYDSKYVPVDASKVFSGIFDGKGKTISNLKVSSTVGGADEDANVGLFGITGAGAVIKNLTLTNVNIVTDGRNVGALAGYAYNATLDNIIVNGNIQIKGGNNVSGVAGMTRHYDVTATNITVSGAEGSAIVGNNIVGGIFAEIAPNGSEQKFDGLHVENIAITGVGGVGGIVGLLTQGTVKNVSVKNVVLTGRTDYQGNAMGRIRLGSVSGLMGGKYATIANEVIENVTAKNLDGNAVELPVIGANYDASSNATEAKIGDKYYATFAAAYKVAQAGDVINLFADIEATEVILLDKSLTINGNGHKVTSSATRVFRVTTANTEVTLNDVKMVSTAVRVGTNDVRGISIDNVENVKLTLNNSSVAFTDASANDWAYAVNVTGGKDHVVTVIGGTYEGANVINVRGANNTVTVKDATLTSTYPINDQYYGACIWVQQNQGSSVEATGNTFNGNNAIAFNLGTGTTLTESNNTDNTGVVATIDGKPYASLEAAFKAATSGCVINIINNVTVDTKWDCRYTGAKFTVPVTINGNGKTIKFTGSVSDSNWNTVFRFEDNATVKNLTVDIANATGAQRVISAKKSLNVDALNIVGSARYGIIFGEGANATDLAATEIVVKNSTLNGTRRAISDNEGGKDVKSVEITGNTLNANAYISASESIVFNNNTVNGEVDLRSYTAENVLSVVAQENTLKEGVKNYIYAKTIDAQDEFETKNPPLKVSNKAELDAALAAAKEGNTITLTADIDYGTAQLAIAKAITLDLGGKTLTTQNAYGGMSVKNNPTIKNGTIVHKSNTAAIKVWNATAFEDLVIDVQGKGDANKTIGGIVLQSGSTTRVGLIKNVTIKGAALTNGIETYNCGDATENVIGAMENVAINAQGTGMLISAPCGTATNCSISGGTNGIEIWIKGNYSASLNLVESTVEGGVFAHDEFNSNPDIVNNGTLSLTADEATTGAGVEDVTLTIARAEENLEGVIKEVMEAAQAKIGDTYYTTIAKAISAAQAGETVTILAGTYPVPAVKVGITIEGEMVEGEVAVFLEGTLSGTLEDLTMRNIHIEGGNAQRWAYAKGNLLFENVTFKATSVYALHFDGITEGTNLTYKDCTIIGWAAMGGLPASCKFEGCTIKGNGTYGVIRTYFDATIKDCTFDVANVNANDNYEDGIHAVDGAYVTVTGCTNNNGDMIDLVNIHALSIVKLGSVEIKNVVKANDNYYRTLAEAFAAVGVGNGKTVELIRDVDLAGAEWSPVDFNGVFDGQNHTISNLVVNGAGKSNQGFFGTTQNGEIKNVTFNNAKVTGRLNVGVVAGQPYTSKYTNVKVTGHVEVNGMAYVGGVGGKNAYANWTDITVDVDPTSYVEANSVENGTAYRTYVGGVVGFNGEGGHTFKNISSNIKVIGSTMDIGGIFGIAHYNNKFENIKFTGAVEAPAEAEEVGGIAGVWHNEEGTSVTFTDCTSTGTVKVGEVETTGSIVGGAYNAANETEENSGSLIIDGVEAWLKVAQVGEVKYLTLAEAVAAVTENTTITMLADVELTSTVTVAKGQDVTLNLNGKTISAAITEQLTKSFAAIQNRGTLTVKDSATTRAAGRITVSYAGNTFGYGVGLYTISNEGGVLNIESGIVENTTTVSGSMYDAIDNNSTLGETVLNITGGEVRCPEYIGVRQFANSTTHNNIVNVTGGKVVGGNTSIWMQNPGSNQPYATIEISGDANIEGRLLAGTSDNFEFNVTGGTFTTNVEDFCADDFSAVQTGPNTWVVKQTSGELTRTLPEGWSWFSSYVNISGAEGLETLEEELETSGIQIKDEAGRQFAQYSPTSGWYGNLTEASSTKMYSIKTSAAVEVNLEGEFFGVENYQPVLRTGWNYISYPHHEAIDLATALRGFTPVEGDVIKSKKISAIYTSEGWFNAFKLNPGEGYMYRSKDANKQVAYTTEAVRSTSRSFVSEAPEHWTADATQYPGNMTMIATLDVEGADYEVAAFVDGEVRGSARPIYVDFLDQYIVVMTINGENVANVTFKYYDLNEGEVYDLNNVVVYSDNAILGSVENPYALTRGTTGIDESSINSINIYPNPTTTDREINLQATCDKVEVFNTLGVKVAEYQNVDTIDALETAGTYVIRVTLNGDVKHCRLIVK